MFAVAPQVRERDAPPQGPPPEAEEPDEPDLVLLQPHTGWYDDPDDPELRRYWDGVCWRGKPRRDVPSRGPFPGARMVPRSQLPQYRPPAVGPPTNLTPAERLRRWRLAALVAGVPALVGQLFLWYGTPGGYGSLWSAYPGLAAGATLACVLALLAGAVPARPGRAAATLGMLAAWVALLCVLVGLRAPAGGHLERGALLTTGAAIVLSTAMTSMWRLRRGAP